MDKTLQIINEAENNLVNIFKHFENIAFINQKKIINAFQKCRVSTRHFNGTNGYGYDDIGRDTLNEVFANIFNTDNAIVSPYFTCGSHTISTVLYGLLRPNDYMLSITGMPYDTLKETILGVEGVDNGSLKDFNIKFKHINFIDDKIDTNSIIKNLISLQPKVVFIQRSRGYNHRNALSITQIKELCDMIKTHSKNSFIVVDNCYGEFIEAKEPTEVGADVCVGSLIKNPGGGLACTGGYIVGTAKAINLIACRYTCPSLKTEVGSFELGYRQFYQGLFMAPTTVCNAVKGTYLLGECMQKLGYEILPKSNEIAGDIIKSIKFNTAEELINFVQLIQKVSPIDGYVVPEPWDMPGYENKVIMAAGTFVSGASIELSCDSPIKKPYIAYFQGGLTYEHTKMATEFILNKFLN